MKGELVCLNCQNLAWARKEDLDRHMCGRCKSRSVIHLDRLFKIVMKIASLLDSEPEDVVVQYSDLIMVVDIAKEWDIAINRMPLDRGVRASVAIMDIAMKCRGGLSSQEIENRVILVLREWEKKRNE